MRQPRAVFVEHLKRQLMPSLEVNVLGHAGLVATFAVVGPLLGQVEAEIDQGVLVPRDVAEVDAELAVLDWRSGVVLANAAP